VTHFKIDSPDLSKAPKSSSCKLFFKMSGEECVYTKVNENGKRLRCRKKAITSDGYCSLHYESSNDARVSNETPELGLSAYDVLMEGEGMDMDDSHNKEQLTTAAPRKEVSSRLLSL
jgi:hypothetical protein